MRFNEVNEMIALSAILLLLFAAAAGAQSNQSEVYRVTVVAKSTKAIRYEQGSLPTRIGFKGTVLMPDAKGKATVTPKRGMTAIDAKFEDVPAPSRFGAQYLTYVLWAVSPEGQTENLGELILDPSDEGRLRVSTRLPTFALIVTAEPYFSVTDPGNVVVLENVVLPETVGKVVELRAKDELFPRGEYVYDRSAGEMNPEDDQNEIEQTITVTNLGPSAAVPVTIAYDASEAFRALRLVSVSAPWTCTPDPGPSAHFACTMSCQDSITST